MKLPKLSKEFIAQCKKEANLGLHKYLAFHKSNEADLKNLKCLIKDNDAPLSLKEMEGCLGGRDFKKLNPIKRLYVTSADQVFDMDINVLSPDLKPSHGFKSILLGLEAQNKLWDILQLKPGDPYNMKKFRRMIGIQLKEKKLIKDPKKLEATIALLNSNDPLWLTWRWMRLLSLCFDLHFQLFTLSDMDDYVGVFVPHKAENASSVYLSKEIGAYIRLGHIGSFKGKQTRHLFVGLDIPQFNE